MRHCPLCGAFNAASGHLLCQISSCLQMEPEGCCLRASRPCKLPGGNLPLRLSCSHGDVLQVDDRLTLAQDIEARLKDFEQKADLYAARERIFGLPPSEYTTLTGKH